ncbi:hypothetical protein PAMA_006881 [Pampus argenteus]
MRGFWIAEDCPTAHAVRHSIVLRKLAFSNHGYKEVSHLLFCRLWTFISFSLPVNMVNVHKGVLVECDPAMKQFLLYLDEKMALGKKFILKDLDDTHVFILAEVVQILQERVGELMDQNSFPITQK